MRCGVVAASLVLVACGGYSERSYRGDGTLRDHGWFSGSGRYTLDLGTVDLGVSGVRHFSLANLPPERLAIGFGFEADPPSGVQVHLKLQGTSRPLIDDSRPLALWVRSSSRGFRTFLYCGGAEGSWSGDPGTAWGCVFRPEANETYQLSVDVAKVAEAGSVARLVVEGGPQDSLP